MHIIEFFIILIYKRHVQNSQKGAFLKLEVVDSSVYFFVCIWSNMRLFWVNLAVWFDFFLSSVNFTQGFSSSNQGIINYFIKLILRSKNIPYTDNFITEFEFS